MTTSSAGFAKLSPDDWRGAGVMAGGKGYVLTPMGQTHYRDVGPRNAKLPMLLIHQSLMSIVEYAEIQDALAALGIRSIASDLPGHGMSDLPPRHLSIPEFADNLLPVLDHLGVGRVIAAGHHTGALLAASLAAHHADRIAGMILHGSPLFNEEERAERRDGPQYDRTPLEDGTHLSRWFRKFPGDPDPQTAANKRSRTWMSLSMFMMGPYIGHHAVYRYDMEPDARAIRAPTLILTDLGDPIHYLDQRLVKLRPDFAYRVFSNNGGMELMNEPVRWAQAAAEFAATVKN